MEVVALQVVPITSPLLNPVQVPVIRIHSLFMMGHPAVQLYPVHQMHQHTKPLPHAVPAVEHYLMVNALHIHILPAVQEFVAGIPV